MRTVGVIRRGRCWKEAVGRGNGVMDLNAIVGFRIK